MYQYSATTIEPLLDEFVGGWKVLQQILVFDVVNLYYHVLLEGAEKLPIQRQAQHRQDMCDVRLL